MIQEKGIISARRFCSAHTPLESEVLSNDSVRYPPEERAPRRPKDYSNRFGLGLQGELFETDYSPTTRKRVRHGVVWQAVDSVRLMQGLAASPPSSKHSEHVVESSFPMTPNTH